MKPIRLSVLSLSTSPEQYVPPEPGGAIRYADAEVHILQLLIVPLSTCLAFFHVK